MSRASAKLAFPLDGLDRCVNERNWEQEEDVMQTLRQFAMKSPVVQLDLQADHAELVTHFLLGIRERRRPQRARVVETAKALTKSKLWEEVFRSQPVLLGQDPVAAAAPSTDLHISSEAPLCETPLGEAPTASQLRSEEQARPSALPEEPCTMLVPRVVENTMSQYEDEAFSQPSPEAANPFERNPAQETARQSWQFDDEPPAASASRIEAASRICQQILDERLPAGSAAARQSRSPSASSSQDGRRESSNSIATPADSFQAAVLAVVAIDSHISFQNWATSAFGNLRNAVLHVGRLPADETAEVLDGQAAHAASVVTHLLDIERLSPIRKRQVYEVMMILFQSPSWRNSVRDSPALVQRGRHHETSEQMQMFFMMFDSSVFDVCSALGWGHVAVECPETQSDGMGASRFTTYQVSGILNGSSFTSRKRYSDFVWFRSVLIVRLPGVFIPPLPGKKQVGRFHAAFIEDRRLGLQHFLRRIFQRQDICRRLPLLMTFLTSGYAEIERLKPEIDSHPAADILNDYQVVFAALLVSHAAPLSGTEVSNSTPLDDKISLVKSFLEKHIHLLSRVQSQTTLLKNEQAQRVSKTTRLLASLDQLVDDETLQLRTFFERSPPIRDELLGHLHRDMEIETTGTEKATSILNASLQHEIEDCQALEEAIGSIQRLRKRLFLKRTSINSNTVSRSRLSTEYTDEPAEAPVAVQLRKRDKTKKLLGSVSSTFKDTAAQAGFNKERRLTDLDESIRDLAVETATLQSQIDAATTVFCVTEVSNFLEMKAAGCHWGQAQFAAQRALMYQNLAECWANPAEPRGNWPSVDRQVSPQSADDHISVEREPDAKQSAGCSIQ